MSGPNYFDKQRAKSTGPDYENRSKRGSGPNWRKHEEEVAERSGGRQQPGSGNKPGRPADTTDTRFLRECKSTKSAGISLKADWLKKIVEDAADRGKTPMIELRLEGQAPPVPQDWLLIPALDFEEYYGNH